MTAVSLWSSAGHRVQVCPALALAAVNAQARALLPATFAASPGETNPAVCPPAEAVARVERWLIATRGSELRKARTPEMALRCVAHVAYVWSQADDTERECGGQCCPALGGDAARRRQRAALHTTTVTLPTNRFAAHLIGRSGRFIRPLLGQHPNVRVRFEDNTATITGSVLDHVSALAQKLDNKIREELRIQDQVAAESANRVIARMIEANLHATAVAEDTVDVLERERQYRERNAERERNDRQRNCSEQRRMHGRRRAAPTLLRFRALRTKGLAYDLRECVSCS